LHNINHWSGFDVPSSIYIFVIEIVKAVISHYDLSCALISKSCL